MFGNPVGRQVGVMLSTTQPESAPTQKLLNMQPCEFVAIEYGDAQGQKHTNIAMLVGGRWYMPPNGEVWAQTLRPMSEWLSSQLDEAAASKRERSAPEAPMPTTDQVDIFPSAEKPVAKAGAA